MNTKVSKGADSPAIAIYNFLYNELRQLVRIRSYSKFQKLLNLHMVTHVLKAVVKSNCYKYVLKICKSVHKQLCT